MLRANPNRNPNPDPKDTRRRHTHGHGPRGTGGTHSANPGGAALEGLEGAAVVDFALGGVLVPELVVEGAAGGDVDGGAGSLLLSWLAPCRA